MSNLDSRRIAFIVLLFSVVFNSIGQIYFKATRIAHPTDSIFSLFYYVETWAGLILYALSALCWLWVLSRVQLSYAYPVLSLSFPIVVGLSAILFSEAISPLRWIGVVTIVIGVSLIART
jgi:drug/metabolite transporter (DMT)-like permease